MTSTFTPIPLANEILPTDLDKSVYVTYARARKASLTALELHERNTAARRGKHTFAQIDRAALAAGVETPNTPTTYSLVHEIVAIFGDHRSNSDDLSVVLRTAFELFIQHDGALTAFGIRTLTGDQMIRAAHRATGKGLRGSAHRTLIRDLLEAFVGQGAAQSPSSATSGSPQVAIPVETLSKLLHDFADSLLRISK